MKPTADPRTTARTLLPSRRRTCGRTRAWLIVAFLAVASLAARAQPIDPIVPVTMEVQLVEPMVDVGTQFDVVVTVDTSDLAFGLDTAGIRLKGVAPIFDVVDIQPGPDFSSLSTVELGPPYMGYSYPGVLLFVDPFAITGAAGTDLELATFTLETIALGTTTLELEFWDAPPLVPEDPTTGFVNFLAWEDPLGPPVEHLYLDSFVVFRGATTLTSVPEPCSLVIVALGGIVAAVRRRRR